jgi:hypothetical protein
MPCKTDVAIAHAIGVDTGKNTQYMICLDEKGAIVLREKKSLDGGFRVCSTRQ